MTLYVISLVSFLKYLRPFQSLDTFQTIKLSSLYESLNVLILFQLDGKNHLFLAK